jgi:superfamily II DNA or RNA helicase
MSRLRGFQSTLQGQAFAAWNAGKTNVLAVMPTGAGKTVLGADTIRVLGRSALAKAHRHELVSQISMALAVERIPHRIIGPDSIRRDCCSLQLTEFGQHWVDANARTAVAGVDTLVRKDMSNDSWARGVGLWWGDEAHHYQQGNKWGDCADMFKHALGLGVTATPNRADGRGLSRESDGVFDEMVEGPDLRWLIDNGYLTDYRVFAPPSDVVYDDVPIGASGDYSQAKLRAAVHASGKFVGSIVEHYLRIAPGKLGVTFAVDVESAGEIAREFRERGVPAEVVSAKTPALRRQQILRDFRARKILQLVNVDLFGEGFDLPAIEVVSFGRKTESLALFIQQFGRALRLMLGPEYLSNWDSYTVEQRVAIIAGSTKPKAIIIDHVGNVIRHGLPDSPRVWDMARRERRSNGISDAIPLRTCSNPRKEDDGLPCVNVYERFRPHCPVCKWVPIIADRSAPEFVDGDLHELSPDTLAILRQRIEQVNAAPGMSAPPYIRSAFQERLAQGYLLRDAIYLYAGMLSHIKPDTTPSEMQRRFFHQFGVDVMTAQTLSRPESEALQTRIETVLARANYQPLPK